MSTLATMEVTVRELIPADRCDRCGAQAYFIAVKNSSELMFCAHHGREFQFGLISSGFIVDDQSSKLREEDFIPA